MGETASATSVEIAAEKKRLPFLLEVATRLVKEKPLGTVGGSIVVMFLLVGILADVLAPYGFNDIDLWSRLIPPGPGYLLGTDNLGRDLLSRVIYGARISMFVGLGAATLSAFLAIIIGGLSGLFGGKVDMVIQRFVDAIMCFPPIVITLTMVAVTGPGLVQVILVIGLVNGISRGTRVVRSAVMGIKENIYIEAARAIGVTNTRMFLRHILPNVMAPIIILFTITVGSAILAEATISFLGFGIPPPVPSWGGMLSESGRRYMLTAPWMVLWPGLALSIVVYGINMLGDGLRDILDPRLRGGLGRYRQGKKKIPGK